MLAMVRIIAQETGIVEVIRPNELILIPMINPNYKTINDDCTDFVSQALHDPTGGRYPYRFGSASNSSTTDDHNWWERYFGAGVFQWTNSFTFAAHLRQFLIYDLPGGIPEGSTPRGDLSAL